MFFCRFSWLEHGITFIFSPTDFPCIRLTITSRSKQPVDSLFSTVRRNPFFSFVASELPCSVLFSCFSFDSSLHYANPNISVSHQIQSQHTCTQPFISISTIIDAATAASSTGTSLFRPHWNPPPVLPPSLDRVR